LALRTIPNRKREHPAQVFDAVAAVLFVKVNDGFCVALRAVAMSSGFEIRAQLLMVVNFTVKDDPNVFVFIGEGLMPGLEVDDAKPAHGEADASFDEEPAIVRATMNDLIIHGSQAFTLNSRVALRQKDSANSTHR